MSTLPVLIGVVLLLATTTKGSMAGQSETLLSNFDCGGALQSSSGVLQYKLGQLYKPEESCGWILKPNELNQGSKLSIQLQQDGFVSNSGGVSIFALSEGGDLQTLHTWRTGDRQIYNWTAPIFLITFNSYSNTYNGTGFLLAFDTIERVPPKFEINVHLLFMRPGEDDRTTYYFPSQDHGFGENELWLMVFQPIFTKDEGAVSVSVSNIDIGEDCNDNKLLTYYTYSGVPGFTRRHCQYARPTTYVSGSNPFVMAFRSGSLVSGKGFKYTARSYRY